MTISEIRRIIAHRLGRWSGHLEREHATPLVMLGVGHDQKSGDLVILTVDEPDLDEAEVPRLRSALAGLPGEDRGVLEQWLGGRTLQDIGAGMGVSKERARQIKVRALSRLRAKMGVQG